MTEVRYLEADGTPACVTEMFKVQPVAKFDRKSDDEIIDNYMKVVSKKEDQLKKYVESNGGKVLSVVSQPISKRRYKRKTAKLIKRNLKILGEEKTETDNYIYE